MNKDLADLVVLSSSAYVVGKRDGIQGDELSDHCTKTQNVISEEARKEKDNLAQLSLSVLNAIEGC